MTRNRILLILLVMFALMAIIPAAQAQERDINFKDILKGLGPRDGDTQYGIPWLLFDILLYIIFFIGLVNMGIIPDKQLFASLLNFGVLGMAVVSKLLVNYPKNDPIIREDDLATLVLNAGMFVVPLIIAGMVRSVKGKPSKAIYTSAFMGLLGGAYFFLYWVGAQNDRQAPEAPPTPDIFLHYFIM